MSPDDVATLLAEQTAIELGLPVQVQPATADTHCYFVVGAWRTALPFYVLDSIREEIEQAAPLPSRGVALALLLFSGVLDELVVAHTLSINAVLRPHAKRYAEQARSSFGATMKRLQNRSSLWPVS